LKKLTTLFPLILTLFAAGALEAQTPTVSVDKTSLSFSAQLAGSAQTQTLTVNNTGSAGFVAFVQYPFGQANQTWLKLDGSSQVGHATPYGITITADPAGQGVGVLTANIAIFGTSPTGAELDVPVTFTVGTVGVTPSTLAFTYQANGAFPGGAPLTLSAATSTNVAVTKTTATGGDWLIVPTGATAPGTLTVSLNPTVVGPSMAVGTYKGTVTIAPPLGPAATVPVTLTIAAAPTVTANPTSVNLNFQLGGAAGATNTPSATLTLTNPGGQDLPFLITPSSNPAGWLTVTPPSGTIPANGSAQVTVAYATSSNLAPATYSNNSLAIFIPGAAVSQINVPVKLLVSASPLLTVPNANLAFSYQIGGAQPASQSVLATSSAVAENATSGQMPLIISSTTATGGPWLSVPNTGVTGTNIPVSVNPIGLAVGTYSGTISVTGVGAGNGAQTIPVTLTVSNDPLIVATFGGCSTQSTTCPLNFPIQTGQNNPVTQNIAVTSSTGAQASFSATVAITPSQANCAAGWLSSGVTTAQLGNSATFPISVTPPATVPAAGVTCTGTITITGINPTTGIALPNSPVTIPVTMYASANAMLVAAPVALNFSVVPNGNDFKTLTVTSTSSTNLDFTVSTAQSSPWLSATASGNTAAGRNGVILAVNANGLAPGTYSSSITLNSTGVLDSPLTVPVTLTVTAATMTVTPNSLSFSQTKGAAAPDPKTVSVATSSTDIPFTISVNTTKGSGWLSATASSTTATGSSPATVTVKVDGSTLAPDTYTGSVTITSTSAFTSGSPVTIPVTLEVKAGTISVTPVSLTFTQVAGGAVPASQTLAVAGAPGALSYTVTTATSNNSGNWLSVDTATGTTPGNVKVSVNAGTLPPATYNGTVTIASTGATGSPLSVPVTLVVTSGQTITVSPSSLNFSYIIGTSTAPAQQTVSLSSSSATTPFTTSVSSGATWLTVSPTSGTGAATLAINVNPTGLAAGNYTGTISVNSTSAVSNPAASIVVNLVVQAVPKPAPSSLASAASYVTGAVSPGENIVIFGSGLGPAALVLGHVTNNAFDTLLSDTQVFFDATPAPIVYASANQTSVMVPYGVAGRATTSIRIVYKGVQSDPIPYTVVATTPAIYTANSGGFGQGAILNQDLSVNGAGNAAAKGTVVAIYMTGEGVTSPASVDGVIAGVNGAGLFKPVQTVTATVGGVPATVEYAGSAPSILYGVMQVNVRIPDTATSGNAALVINVGSTPTQANVTVAVK
jgi:uncharacterized protein (TIGR03437 family)